MKQSTKVPLSGMFSPKKLKQMEFYKGLKVNVFSYNKIHAWHTTLGTVGVNAGVLDFCGLA